MPERHRKMCLAIVGATSWLALVTAQPSPPRFEVVSVKPHNAAAPPWLNGVRILPSGRFEAIGTTVRGLLPSAYPLRSFQFLGGPGWIDSEEFDVVATTGIGLRPPHEMQAMTRALLAERFGLVAHEETRERPFYALMLASSDGKLGPNLQKATVDCAAQRRTPIGPDAPPRLERFDPMAPVTCGMTTGPGIVNAGGLPMGQLARRLEYFVDRLVVDRTGLSGEYTLQLRWTPQLGDPGVTFTVRGLPDISLFTALKEQLGLKLEPDRGPLQVIIVDRAERPTPD